MYLKLACFVLLVLAFLVVIVKSTDQVQFSPSIQLTRYKKIKDMTVTSVRTPIIRLGEPYRVRESNQCPLGCNRLPNCRAVTVNETMFCSLLSDLITLLDLENEIGTLMMVKSPIQECPNPEYFADLIEKVCRQKLNDSMACSRNGECAGSKGLVCTDGVCQCEFPDKKYEIIRYFLKK